MKSTRLISILVLVSLLAFSPATGAQQADRTLRSLVTLVALIVVAPANADGYIERGEEVARQSGSRWRLLEERDPLSGVISLVAVSTTTNADGVTVESRIECGEGFAGNSGVPVPQLIVRPARGSETASFAPRRGRMKINSEIMDSAWSEGDFRNIFIQKPPSPRSRIQDGFLRFKNMRVHEWIVELPTDRSAIVIHAPPLDPAIRRVIQVCGDEHEAQAAAVRERQREAVRLIREEAERTAPQRQEAERRQREEEARAASQRQEAERRQREERLAAQARAYSSEVAVHVERRWRQPERSRASDEAVVVVHINPTTGHILRFNVDSCSGSAAFCESVRQAMERLESLPRPPDAEAVRGGVRIRFSPETR